MNFWILAVFAVSGTAVGVMAVWLIRILIEQRAGYIPKNYFTSGYRAYLISCIAHAVVYSLLYAVYLDIVPATEYSLLFSISYAIAVIDALIRRIPNELLLAILLEKLIFTLFVYRSFGLTANFIGLIAAAAVFVIPSLFRLNIGMGDIKYGMAIGFYFGLSGFLQVMIVMSLISLLIWIYLKATKKGNLKTLTPMGTSIAMGVATVCFWPFLSFTL